MRSRQGAKRSIEWPQRTEIRLSFRLTGVTLCIVNFLLLTSGQQLSNLNGNNHQAEVLTEVGSTVQAQLQAAATIKPLGHKIGMAPHDRLACQLPPIGHQRRQNHHNHQHLQSSPQVAGSLDQAEPQGNNFTTRSSSRTSPQFAQVTQPALVTQTTPGGNLEAKSDHVVPNNKRFDSSERLRQLRQLLASNSYDAYLVTPNDEHGTEYTSDYDRRLKFISGFTGSMGFALIMLDRAVLFTDGRYLLQADQELDCNWWLVANNEPLTDIPLWLKENAANGLKIATDARLMSLQNFDYLEDHIRRQDSEFALISQDLIDVVWNNHANGDAPRARPEDPLFVHPLQFTGNVTWQEKLVRLADSMGKLGARHYIVSQLDDIAWLLNLRGNDIPMMPLFKAYLLISRSLPGEAQLSAPPSRVTPVASSVDQLLASSSQQSQRLPQQALQSPQVLQVQPSQSIKLTLYVDLNKIDQQVRDHLHVDNGTVIVHYPTTTGANNPPQLTTRIQVELRDYEVFIMDIRDKLNPVGGAISKGQLQGRLLLNAGANVAIHVLAKSFEDRLVLVESLINKLKAVKMDGEVQGMRLAHWRDSLAIAMLLAQLDQDIGDRQLTSKWSEVSAAKELEFYRSLMDHNKGQSFATISAYGPNGAIVHYSPDHTDEHPQLIGNQSTYLLDCGGQYLDGTTDITRTMHYGEPSEFQRETYTRVLMGAIDVMSLIFDQSAGATFRINDLLARRHLFELGLDYAHGTGHGIGLYSMVHEAPWLLDNYATGTNAKRQQSTSKQPSGLVHSEPLPLQANMFTSVEPGYYKANDFGIRLENIVVSQRVNLPGALVRTNDRQEARLAAGERQFLRFEPLSLVPFEPKLIKNELLSNKHKAWLNSYNLMVRFRMTQQINYYLNKIRGHQANNPTTRQGARLYRQLFQTGPPPSAGNRSDLGQLNFLRLEGGRLQEKLESTHRWIMSKTELIPLDVPQALVNTNNPKVQANRCEQEATAGGRRDNNEQRETGDHHLQRLMLAYMAGLPFNDKEAGEAVAALGGEAPILAGRIGGQWNTSDPDSETTRAHLAEGNKCSGFECDLWLLGSLNRAAASSSNSRVQRQRPQSSSGWFPEEDAADGPEGLGASGAASQNLFDLFQLNGSKYPVLPINMWSMLVLGLLIMLQLGIVSFMCRRSGAAGSATLYQAPPSAS